MDNLTDKEKEELNHQAYDDIMEMLSPTMPHNEYYMECYRFWYPLSAMAADDRKHDADYP